MNYTESQIKKAKRNYEAFLTYRSPEFYSPSIIGMLEAQRRSESHNKEVKAIYAGDKTLEREWKLFFLNEEVKADNKKAASKAKLAANKAASADVLEPIKKIRKLGAFGKWLNNKANPYRKQHFNKKYTKEAVHTFLATL